MKEENLKDRTREFVIRILNMASMLPRENSTQILSRQIVNSALIAGANYWAACRSRSRREFVSRLKLVEQEMNQTEFLLILIEESRIFPEERISPLLKESHELLSIMAKSGQTARENLSRKTVKS